MKLGIVMDPIAGIKIEKDSSFAMLLAAQAKGWDIYYMEVCDLFFTRNTASANIRRLSVTDCSTSWYRFHEMYTSPLTQLDIILMRKDPPVDMEFMYATHLLELAQRAGTFVVNDPASLRNANEKLFISRFPQCITPMLVACQAEYLLAFLDEHKDIILKPLNSMGGNSIFRVRDSDPNTKVIIETLTKNGSEHIMAQRFIPEIKNGDKRILLINGEPVPYALARIPGAGDMRGNLVAGALGKGVELTDRDRWICKQLSPTLKQEKLFFVGIDVIGDYLTEINVTSPTCIRELDSIYDLNIASDLMDALQQRIDQDSA